MKKGGGEKREERQMGETVGKVVHHGICQSNLAAWKTSGMKKKGDAEGKTGRNRPNTTIRLASSSFGGRER